MTTEVPLGEIVDFDPTAPEPATRRAEAPLAILDPAPVTNWRASSHDLLGGLDVTDQTDSIPGELFDRLFNR
jgi:hypothetical protein